MNTLKLNGGKLFSIIDLNISQYWNNQYMIL